MNKIFLILTILIVPTLCHAANYEVTVQGNNVGIGTINPGAALDVEASISPVALFGGGNVGIGSSNPQAALDINSAGNTNFLTNVGINSTSPQALLDVNGSGNTNFITNVGIGSASPGQSLDVMGTIRIGLGYALAVTPGTNGCAGQATLSSGVVTVSTTCTPSTSQGLFVTDAQSSITNVGSVTIATVNAGSSFVIQSTNVLDASKVNWEIHKTS